jgi:hypothetical protein
MLGFKTRESYQDTKNKNLSKQSKSEHGRSKNSKRLVAVAGLALLSFFGKVEFNKFEATQTKQRNEIAVLTTEAMLTKALGNQGINGVKKVGLSNPSIVNDSTLSTKSIINDMEVTLNSPNSTNQYSFFVSESVSKSAPKSNPLWYLYENMNGPNGEIAKVAQITDASTEVQTLTTFENLNYNTSRHP